MALVMSVLLILIAVFFTIAVTDKLVDHVCVAALKRRRPRSFSMRMLKRRMRTYGSSSRVALLCVDFKDFLSLKKALELKAHADLLKCVESRLAKVVGWSQLFSDASAAKFVIVVDGDDTPRRAAALADSMCQQFDCAVNILGSMYLLHLSVGVAVHRTPEDTEFDLLGKAELALEEAGRSVSVQGASQFVVYTPKLSTRARDEIERYRALQYAINQGGLFLEYQPIFGLSGELKGAEALVRCKHPVKKRMQPDEFIPLAESNGFIKHIGKFVIEQACRDFHVWSGCSQRSLTLSLNVSPLQLRGELVLHTLKRCLSAYEIEPKNLQIEVTESVMIEEGGEIWAMLERIRELGVRIVLDDFGAGYSSLSQLSHLPLDGVKIDQNILRGIPAKIASSILASHIISLIRQLDLSLVIEGVETCEQVRWLSQFGEMDVQGFYYSKPIEASDFERMYINREQGCIAGG